jgi:diadenosine tetraphosphate (Ap4A) HIT family hydrolase
MARAQGAKTIPDTYDAIRFALGLLGDEHSHYQSNQHLHIHIISGKPLSPEYRQPKASLPSEELCRHSYQG